MSRILVFLDTDRGSLSPSGLEALTPALSLAETLAASLEVVTVGQDGQSVLESIGLPGYVISHPILSDYAPEAYGEALAQLAGKAEASVLISLGDDRGSEVMAHAAASLDQPLVANVIEITKTSDERGGDWEMIRVRWGGSLLERTRLRSSVKLLTVAPHTFAPHEPDAGATAAVDIFVPDLPESTARTRVVEAGPPGGRHHPGHRPGGGERRERRGKRREFRHPRGVGRIVGGSGGMLAGGNKQRLASPLRPGRPDRHPGGA